MPRLRIKISCAGLTSREVKRNTPELQEDLLARPEVENPIVAWDDDSELLLVIIEAEGDDSGQVGDAALEEISESIIAAFESEDEQHLIFRIESAQAIGGDQRMPS
jgi:hypothetical protein